MTTTETGTPAAAAPAAAAATPAPAAAAPAAASTPATASPSSAAPAAASSPAAGADDLVTGAPAKPADPAAAKPTEKAPETPAEKRAYLEGKTADADKEALKGKTDAEIETLFKDQQAKDTEAAALGDFDATKLTLPEDMPIPEAMKTEVNDLAKIFNNKEMTAQEKFQKAVDLHVKIQNQQLEDFKAVKDGWRAKSLADRELGNGNPEAHKAIVGKANDIVRKFAGTPAQLEEFQVGLKFLGLGNHPAFIRFCNNVAKATGEDGLDGSTNNTSAGTKDLATLMYPDMKQAT